MFLDKDKIKNELTIENIYTLLDDFGGEPQYSNNGIISSTICHNPPGDGSRKLYYYNNSNLFHCFTGCEEPSFDIFELVIKVYAIQYNTILNLVDAVKWIANRFGLYVFAESKEFQSNLADWKAFDNYKQIQEINPFSKDIVLKDYDENILNNFIYDISLDPWLKDGISEEIMHQSRIGFYPGQYQITIPHYDQNNRFIGLRGRSLAEEDCEFYGKYHPLKINKILYSHPLGLNLYNLNNSKNNIKIIKKAIVLESEKATLQYRTMFGTENDISVACCGSNLTSYQTQLLINAGANEIIVAFDRQFQEIGDEEFNRLTKNLRKINEHYGKYALISFIFDKERITSYKASPTDEGKEKFIELFNKRIIL